MTNIKEMGSTLFSTNLIIYKFLYRLTSMNDIYPYWQSMHTRTNFPMLATFTLRLILDPAIV